MVLVTQTLGQSCVQRTVTSEVLIFIFFSLLLHALLHGCVLVGIAVCIIYFFFSLSLFPCIHIERSACNIYKCVHVCVNIYFTVN